MSKLQEEFHWACKNGHLEVVKLLLADGRIDPSVRDNYSFIWTCCNGHKEIIELLKQHGVRR